MQIIIILIFVSLAIALGFLGLFLWNLKNGQYDDVYTPSVRMLFEEQKKEKLTKISPGENVSQASPETHPSTL